MNLTLSDKKKKALALLFIFAGVIIFCFTLLNKESSIASQKHYEDTVKQFVVAVQENNFSYFDNLTSDKILKTYSNDTEQKNKKFKDKPAVLSDLHSELTDDFGPNFKLTVQKCSGNEMASLWSTKYSVLCTGFAEGDSDSGIFAFGFIISDGLVEKITYYDKEYVKELMSDTNTTEISDTTEIFELPDETTTFVSKYLWEY